jgi:hypothetical protein
VNQPPSGPSPWQDKPPADFYGELPPYPQYVQPAPQVARRQRPSPGWFVITVTMFVVACGLAVVLIASFARGLSKLSDVNATVMATGSPVSVYLAPDTSFLMWDQAAYVDECTVIDQLTGTSVTTSGLHASSFYRTDRSGAWYGARYIDSGSGNLQVTCAPLGGPVQFGARPVAGDVLGNTGLTILAMVLLGTAGLVGFIVTLVLFVTRAPRKPEAQAGMN